MTDPNATQEMEIVSGDKKLRMRGSDLLTSVIGMIVCSGLAIVVYILLDHKTDARDTGTAMVQAVREMTQAQRDNTKEQRVMNCLIATDQKDREAKVSQCERMAR